MRGQREKSAREGFCPLTKKCTSTVSIAAAAIMLASAAAWAGEPTGGPTPSVEKSAGHEAPPSAEASYETLPLRGRVVWLGDALERLFGVKCVPEARQRGLVLETPGGELHPLVEDARGRSFRLDARLRDRDVELLVRRYAGSPLVQVVRVSFVKSDGLYEVDYWCEICSIAMYELKACDCCQGPIELRERPLADSDHRIQSPACQRSGDE